MSYCLTFLRLASKLSGMITRFRGSSLKFNLDRSLISMVSKSAFLTFKEYPQINALVSKIDGSYKLYVEIAKKRKSSAVKGDKRVKFID